MQFTPSIAIDLRIFQSRDVFHLFYLYEFKITTHFPRFFRVIPYQRPK